MALAAFLVLFTALWAGLAWFFAWQSGWNDLAKRFPAGGPAPDGERRRWTSASLDKVSFRSSLNLVAGANGLYLSPVLLFRPFMPPLLIPWSEIRFLELAKALSFHRAHFRLGAAEGPTLEVGDGLARLIASRLPAPQRDRFEAEERANPPASPRTKALVGLVFGALASGLFYAFAGGEPHGPPLTIILLPVVLFPLIFLWQDR